MCPGQAVLNAIVDSGLRVILGYNNALRMSNWDQSECVPEQDLIPDWALKQVGEFAQKHNKTSSVVEIGLGFDLWFLPKDMVLPMLENLRQQGLRLVTTHVTRNALMSGFHTGFLIYSHQLTTCARSAVANPHVQLI
jgi:hypothetical protein